MYLFNGFPFFFFNGSLEHIHLEYVTGSLCFTSSVSSVWGNLQVFGVGQCSRRALVVGKAKRSSCPLYAWTWTEANKQPPSPWTGSCCSRWAGSSLRGAGLYFPPPLFGMHIQILQFTFVVSTIKTRLSVTCEIVLRKPAHTSLLNQPWGR